MFYTVMFVLHLFYEHILLVVSFCQLDCILITFHLMQVRCYYSFCFYIDTQFSRSYVKRYEMYAYKKRRCLFSSRAFFEQTNEMLISKSSRRICMQLRDIFAPLVRRSYRSNNSQLVSFSS